MALIRDRFRCDECGYDNERLDNAEVVALIAEQAVLYPAVIDSEPIDYLLMRPSPDVWSAMEYAAHQRDVIEWYADRIVRVLTEDRPALSGYDFSVASQPSADVSGEIVDAVARVLDLLRPLDEEQWMRVGTGSIDGGERTVRNLASRVAHEGVHHLLDIDRSLRAVQS